MDELDSKIIKLLQMDGRVSQAEIARATGVSETTVRRRLKALIDEEFIRIVALPDSEKIGAGSDALIGVLVDPDKIDRVADAIAELSGVMWVAEMTGSYDIFAWVTFPSHDMLAVFLRTKLGAISGVRRTETFVNLAIRKHVQSVII